jgi:arsenate reductase
MKILFVCTGNSCRSQMAEGYARSLGKNIFEIKSAGIEPHGINSHAIQVMKEDGIDISHQESTKISNDLLQWADLIITLCHDAEKRCPILPASVKKMHWSFIDPAKAIGSEQEKLATFRQVRDGIKTKVVKLLRQLQHNK